MHVSGFLLLSSRLMLASFLFIAAGTKLSGYDDARAAIATHFGFRRARYATPVLVVVELGCATLLVTPGTRMVGGIAAGVVLMGFSIFSISLALNNDGALSCGCFGLGIPSRASSFSVGRNITLVLIAVLIAVRPRPTLNATAEVAAVTCGIAVSIVVIGIGALDAIRATRRGSTSIHGRLNQEVS